MLIAGIRKLWRRRQAKRLRRLMEFSYQSWQENAVSKSIFAPEDFRANDRQVYHMYHNSLEFLQDQGFALSLETAHALFPLVALLGAGPLKLPPRLDDFLDFRLISFYANYNQLMQTCATPPGLFISPALVIAHGQVYGNAYCSGDRVEVETHYQQPSGPGAPTVEFLPVNLISRRGAIASSPEQRPSATRRFRSDEMNPEQEAIYQMVRSLLQDHWPRVAAKQYYDGAVENTLELFVNTWPLAVDYLPEAAARHLLAADCRHLAEDAKKLPILLAVAELHEGNPLEEIVFDLTYAGSND